MDEKLLSPLLVAEGGGGSGYKWLVLYHFVPNYCSIVMMSLFIPSRKTEFSGVYCFQHVCGSVIPKFRQHLMILLYNFDSFWPILFKFTPHHNH